MSKLISRAILHFVEVQSKEVLRERLKREALANAFPLEQEALGRRSPRRRRSKTRKTNSL